MPVTAESDLVFSWSVSFFLTFLAPEKALHYTTSETQKDDLKVKTTGKKETVLPLEPAVVFQS